VDISTLEFSAILQAFTNITLIITMAKLIRHLSRMELKVEMMWRVFSKKFDIEDEPSGEIIR
jgi:hypothetical protein